VVPFADTAAAAAAIVGLANDEPLRIRLGVQAREKVARGHSAGPGAARLAAVLAGMKRTPA
jgi:hypothetical protein